MTAQTAPHASVERGLVTAQLALHFVHHFHELRLDRSAVHEGVLLKHVVDHAVNRQLEGEGKQLRKRSIETRLLHDDADVSSVGHLLEDLSAVTAGDFAD